MWKTVKRNPKYEVNESGIVRTKATGKIKVPKIDRYGYYVLCLADSGKRSYPTVHRLVAEAFIPNPDGLPQVNHKDENKLNNDVSNLEWCTNKYNSTYGTTIERSAAHRCKPVIAYKDGIEVKRYGSIKEASCLNGVSTQSIRGALKGKQHTSCGYTWEYAERG